MTEGGAYFSAGKTRAILVFVDHVNTLGPLAQYGAVGIVAGLLLLLVIGLFKTFVDNALKSNAELQKQNFEMQSQNLIALNGIKAELTATKTEVVGAVAAMKNELSGDIRELDHTVSNMFNELSAITGGSRGYAINKPVPRRPGT